jgi:ComF family protein
MTFKWWDGFTSLFIPKLCLGCQYKERPSGQILCFQCASELPVTRHWERLYNGFTDRIMGRFPFITASSYLFFTPGGTVQNLIHELKYNRRQEVGKQLGQAFGHQLGLAEHYQHIDALIPVPLTPDRQLSRGYNQSEVLAQGIGMSMSIPVLPSVLVRIKSKVSQTKMGREERLKNIMQSFKLLDGASIKGRHILLVDDVMTTGATLDACCQCLLNGNPASIRLATLAMAVNY